LRRAIERADGAAILGGDSLLLDCNPPNSVLSRAVSHRRFFVMARLVRAIQTSTLPGIIQQAPSCSIWSSRAAKQISWWPRGRPRVPFSASNGPVIHVFSSMGPVAFQPGEGSNLRPHPYIGLSTVHPTFFFDGEVHPPRQPGLYIQKNLARGGERDDRGLRIVHSERTDRRSGRAAPMHGLQAWVSCRLNEGTRQGFRASRHVRRCPAGICPNQVCGAPDRGVLAYGLSNGVRTLVRGLFYRTQT